MQVGHLVSANKQATRGLVVVGTRHDFDRFPCSTDHHLLTRITSNLVAVREVQVLDAILDARLACHGGAHVRLLA